MIGTGLPVAASVVLFQGTAMSVPELVRYNTCPVGAYQAPTASSKSARIVSLRTSYTYTRLGRQLTGPTQLVRWAVNRMPRASGRGVGSHVERPPSVAGDAITCDAASPERRRRRVWVGR